MKIKVLQIGKSKIAAIKLIKDISGLGLKESKEISENPNYIFKVTSPNFTFADIEQQFIKINAKIELISENNQILPSEDSDELDKIYVIRILSKGNNLLDSIKVIRTYSSLGIKDCKIILNNIPSMFTIKLSDTLLNEFCDKLTISNIEYQLKEVKNNVGATDEEVENIIHLRITFISISNKILLIKSFRSIFDLGLKEAKKIADISNTNIYCSIPETKLEWIKTTLRQSKAEFYFTFLTQKDFPKNVFLLQLRNDIA